MDNKSFYRQYCNEISIPLYLHSEWLDAVAFNAGNWDVIFSRNARDEIQGYWIYFHKTQVFWDKLTMPPFTPYMGPRLIYPDNLNEYDKISFENKVLTDLIEKLPDFASVQFKWTKEYQNWLPFYWKEYSQQTAYTYIIQDTSDKDLLFTSFKNSIQRQIRKAQQQLVIRQTEEIDGVLSMFKKSLQGKAEKLVNEDLLRRLHLVGIQKKQVMILEAMDSLSKVVGAVYLVFDEKEMLYLYGGYDDTLNDSGAMPLLFWSALEIALQKGLSFNFEGSMLKGVERFFRSFGAQLTPVFTIEKKGFPYKYLDALI